MNNTTLFDNMFAIEFNDDTPNDVLFEAAARADDLRAFAAEMMNDRIIYTKAKEIETYYDTKFDFLFNIIVSRDLIEEFDTYRETSYGLWVD